MRTPCILLCLFLAVTAANAAPLVASGPGKDAPSYADLGEAYSRQRGAVLTLSRDSTLETPLRLRPGSRLDGAQRTVHVGPHGRIIGHDVENVVIENFTFILWEGLDLAAVSQNFLFHFRDSKRVTFRNNRIVVRVRRPDAQLPLTSEPEPFGAITSVFQWQGDNQQVHLVGNTFTAEAMYTARLMLDLPDQGQFGPGLKFGAATSTKKNWRIERNLIQGFHEALSLSESENGVIAHNTLRLNSFGNIFVSGAGLRIEANTILFPGAGTSGDGITVSNVRDLHLVGNHIFYGTCYGVWFCGTAESVVIEDNIIASGITSGINLQSLSQEEIPFREIQIRRNIFAHNAAYGTQIFHGHKIVLAENIYIGNESLPAHSRSDQTLEVHFANNRKTATTTPVIKANLDFLLPLDEPR